MTEATKQAILSVIRTTLAALGTILAGKGVIDDATYQQILGAIMVIIPMIWGAWEKFTSEKKTQQREVNGVRAGIAAAVDPTNTINTPDVSAQTAKAVISTYGAQP